jgi:bis(5'-nucleosyl)-tetraphosphatase (symmetrical)
MAVYAIGDIQGCYDEFLQLLAKIHFNADTDRLWLTGDIVNRGPQSLAALRHVYAMRDNIQLVLGNHDLHMLATAYHFKQPGRHDTFTDILDAKDSVLLLDWLRHQPLIHYDAKLDLCLVHAGLHPQWSVNKAMELAGEVEHILQGEKHVEFYQHMYGDKPPQWSESHSGWSRIRFITNMFTRMRYLDSNGIASMSAKGPPGTQPAGFLPWYELPRASAEVGIIFGHWSSLPTTADYRKFNVFPVDSGCLWGGQLTALRIDTQPFRWTRLDCQPSQNPLQHL